MKDGKIIYSEGRVLVNDYTKDSKIPIELKEYEYQDNILKILEQENIIEELENLKNELSNKIIERNNTINYYSSMKKMLLWVDVITSIIGSILFTSTAFAYNRFNLVNSILFGSIAGTSLPSYLCVFLIFSSIKEKKKAVKEKKGYELELIELEKELHKNKEKLNKISNVKRNSFQNDFKKKKYVDIHNIHLEKYKKIREQLMIYYEIGENENKFSKYYNEGILEEKLQEIYETKEIETVKAYFKTKN